VRVGEKLGALFLCTQVVVERTDPRSTG
jgi:hypothetical protein